MDKRLVELISLAAAEPESNQKVDYLHQIKELVLSPGDGNHLRLSPDGSLFASAGGSCKLVKIWFETSKKNDFSFIYLNHPAPIVSFEWRRTGKFTPRGSVANVLLTSCDDGKVRIWAQTLLPDLVNFKILPHFHLAGIIEDESNCRLVCHWVNNKEMHITKSLEALLQDMLAKVLKDEDPTSTSTSPTNDQDLIDVTNDDTLTAETSKKLRHKLCRKINKQRALAASGRNKETRSMIDQENSSSNGSNGTSSTTPYNGSNSPTSLDDVLDRTVDTLLKEWRRTTDLVFSINKSDGTLTSWQVRHLDGDESGLSRQVQVEEFSRLESILSMPDAITMSNNVTTYLSSAASDSQPTTYMVTQHMSGTLGLWKLNLEQGVDLVTRITGLPISPSWLKDGVLYVDFNEEDNALTTSWVPDEANSIEVEINSSFEGNRDSYKASQLAKNTNILPQYHLKQLVELLTFGKLQRVKAILNHLVNCLAPSDDQHEKKRARRSRTLSILAQSQASFQDSSLELEDQFSPLPQPVVEEIELDYIEVTSIKPLPLYLLLEADVENPNAVDSKGHHAHEEFSASYESIYHSRSQVEETLDEILGKSTIETINKQKELKKLISEEQEKGPLTSFNPRKAKLLTKILTHTHLPGLTNVEQVHLLAVADAVAFFDASPDDLNDLQDEEANDGHGGMSIVSTNIAIDSLDDRGLRFLTAMRQYVYLKKCLPMKQRNDLRISGIGAHNLVWAFHSDTQDELVGLIPCVQRNKPEWSELREFGIGWWLKKLEVLKKLIEKVAQSAYQARQDPLDAALFYLAMKKKTLVCALLRRTNCDKRLLKLFEQDFSDPLNRKKALKNAYALLGLHRFEHAAAFFLLAGSIWDAVEVCINNLNDIQLGIILIRLYDNDSNVPSNLKRLLFTEILGSKMPVDQIGSQPPNDAQQPPPASKPAVDRRPSNLGALQYNYDLSKAHKDPFLRSMAFWKLGDYLSAVHTLLEGDLVDTSVAASIFNFYRFLKEQPLVTKHRHQLLEEVEIRKRSSPIEEEQVHAHRARSLSSGELALEGVAKMAASRMSSIKQSSTEYEVLNETTRLVDKYSDEAIAENERRLFYSTARAYLESDCPMLALEVLCSGDQLSASQAQRMKFIACLQMLLSELKTLAQNHSVSKSSNSGDRNFSEVSNEWLERNLDSLRSVCSFSGSEQPILHTMLTYCSFHIASEESLNTVRLELLDRLSAGSATQLEDVDNQATKSSGGGFGDVAAIAAAAKLQLRQQLDLQRR